MTKIVVDTARAPRPIGPYSQAVISHGLFFSAGFAPHEPETGVMPDNVGDQTRQVLRNLSAVLAEQGATLDDCVKVTVHLQHLKRDFAEYNRAYAEFFTAPFPVRTTVGSQLLDILVEIDVVAVIPPRVTPVD
ncbi:endoribonuclease L-PSP [Cryobacterium roopkundense]|uniref:Endoribonuclease L-PSP n=1 Tax=Cryobacterium roopkundense TaxID=1001240 RepID=A0A099J5H3_9MICO|nr:Rid family hydrolase [Cryobacterium roopkundense]KGJ72757.1 endoribonuclease L-PSP [Cryobacterium roopkundense]MBB5643208.1 reactive intermediate/imine deaminase [Cryobacterium roopkundense]